MAILPDSSLIVRKIGDIERVLCASPAYIEQYGAPQTIEDLENHQCLLLRFPGSQQFRWSLRKGPRTVSVQVSGHLDADDADVLTQWALDGAGIAIKPLFEVADHLRSGALVPVLTRHPPAPVTLAVLHAYNRVAPPKIKAFADMFVSEARSYIARALEGLDDDAARKQASRKTARVK
jgi:DNA-binding transcriptional LysR family regulator